MPLSRHSKLQFTAALWLLLAAWALWSAPASAQTPSAEQLKMLQQLSPEERDAAIELLMDKNLSAGSDEALEEPEEIEPRKVGADANKKENKNEKNGRSGAKTSADRKDSADEGGDDEADDTEEALQPFGYELFAGEPTSFAPATGIPIPVDYIVGPGDTVEVQLFGKDNADYRLVVSRDGMLNFPELGPIPVAGLRFQQMKADLEQRIAEQMIGVKASITMGPLRSIRVFVLGDAYRPGSYTVSALSTMTNALFVSGGIKDNGSLRNIQLKRNGKLVRRLDLYDLLLRGDTSGDARLLPGDVIFVAPVGNRVSVAGEVQRPAIYELRNERTLDEVLKIAGGLLATADPEAARLERIDESRQRTVVDVNLATRAGRDTPVRPGDLLYAVPVLDKFENIVTLSGHVYREGDYQWRRNMRLSDLIASTDMLKPRADLQYVLIQREAPPNRRMELFSADLGLALAARGSSSDPLLRGRDKIFVFDVSGDRQEIIEPIIDELRQQANADSPTAEIGISGRVKAPGYYPLEAQMRVSDAVRAAGGLLESAYTAEAELTRYEVVAGETRVTEHRDIDLRAALSGDSAANLLLQAHDYLNFKEVPQWRDRQVAIIEGEVNFPGEFSLTTGETLRSVLLRAGGLTDIAFPEGAIFVRENIKERERQQLERLAEKLEGDLAGAALEGAQSAKGADVGQALALGSALVDQLRSTEPTGRLVIDLEAVLAGDEGVDIELRDGDILTIPRTTQEVTVVGEVQSPTSHFYERGLSRGDYIDRSGGLTARADKKRVYVVRANGSVAIGSGGSMWFRKNRADGIRPGDTVVVPLDADRVRAITKWANVSQILYQLGLAAASAKTVGVF